MQAFFVSLYSKGEVVMTRELSEKCFQNHTNTHTHTHTHTRKSQKEWGDSRVVVSVTQFGGSTMLFEKAEVVAPIFSNSLGSENSFEVRQRRGMANSTVTPYGCFLPFLPGSFQFMTAVVS